MRPIVAIWRDRRWRQGWAEGRYFYACHLTLDDQPSYAGLWLTTKTLAGMPGIDLIPPQRQHLTMQCTAFTDQTSAAELAAVGDALQAGLASIEQPAVQFSILRCTRKRSTSKLILR